MTFLTKKRGTAGFTLIELLVVIAIIGVLASIVLASLNTARKKSRDTRRVADMNQASLALQLYYDSNRSYPVDGGDITGGVTAPAGLVPTFIAAWPTDPTGGKSYQYDGLTADPGPVGATANQCTSAGTCAFFHIGATVEDNTISAISSRANRCPSAAAGCGATILNSTRVFGTNGATGVDCKNAAATGQGCYDKTP